MGLSRAELYELLGVEIAIAEPMLTTAYQREAEREWRGQEGWDATSFYVSSFPGSDPACDRAAVYSLMGLPAEKPFDVEAMRWMESGKATELEFVRRLAAEGMLLTGNEAAGDAQLKFMEPHVWSSGAVDAIVLPPFWRKGHVVEIKNPGAEKIEQMRGDRNSTPYSHSKYSRQIKAYIGYAHEHQFSPVVTVCRETWAITNDVLPGVHWCPVHRGIVCETETFQVAPPDDGTLLYASRDPQRGRGLDVVEYHFSYDPEFMEAGRRRMAGWRDFFERGELPPHFRGTDKPAWSQDPCRFCNYKPMGCKEDYATKVTRMEDSRAFDLARRVRPDYDYARVRAAVFARWQTPDPLATTAPQEVAA